MIKKKKIKKIKNIVFLKKKKKITNYLYLIEMIK